jgi:DNA-binding ferritin-like protein
MAATENGDESTVGLASGLLESAEKKVWMLKAYLK